MYNYIVLSIPTGFLYIFLHKKINSDKFAFFLIVGIIITVRKASDNGQGASPMNAAQAMQALGHENNRSLKTLHGGNIPTKATALCLRS